MIGLVDIMLRAEAMLEWQLCGLAICQPKAIAGTTIRPEIDLAAKEFFRRFDKRKDEIKAADELRAYQIAYDCCPTYRDFWRFYRSVDDLNTVLEAPKFGAELIAARTARKAIRWVEESGILEKAAAYA